MPRWRASKGIEQVLTCRDGDLVRLAPGVAEIIDEVPAGRLYKDGTLLVDGAQRTVADRRRLGFAGVISVALALSEKGDLLADPDLHLMGIPEKAADGADMAQIAYDAVIETFDGLPRAAAARSGFGRGGGAARRAVADRAALEQEADLSRPSAGDLAAVPELDLPLPWEVNNAQEHMDRGRARLVSGGDGARARLSVTPHHPRRAVPAGRAFGYHARA